MSEQEELTAMQHRLDELLQRVGQLERTVDELRGAGPAASAATESKSPAPELVTIPDTPYNSALWTDSDDEGLGARDRHAP
ncbi:hypothetical protein SLUN_25910 [Streptomyces lunaelactis]|uniref:Uncharacterized protein n=1 Tax=Streptomyces lunaelactis TaxID=1535768 RepID=A0A2R4T7I8_9ACTN|nr:hypothetical protein [Streptomyces lunaelactis]AVZ75113.1 hypothetical protein SLUN_25910 [Streptomyces lunaelactis]NUK84569.1 hypothetical protein [Streptomyces lunaelactis]